MEIKPLGIHPHEILNVQRLKEIQTKCFASEAKSKGGVCGGNPPPDEKNCCFVVSLT